MATRRWLGRAVDLADRWTFTVANTWATNDTATLTINGKDLVLTVGATATTAGVAAAIVAMVNGAAAVGTEGRSALGSEVGEWSRITASVSSSTVTLTADDKGVPFTVSVAESTAGSGTLDSLTNATVATGKHFFSNADNWTGDTVPVDDDVIVFDSGDVDCKYGLSPAIQPAGVIITQGYEGTIGLPEVNTDDPALPYDEYRTKYLTFDDNSVNCAYTIGEGAGPGSGRIRIDAGAGQSTFNVRNTGTRLETNTPALLLLGTHASNELNVQKGDVAAAFFDGEAATLATLRVGYLESIDGDSRVVCGDGVTLSSCTVTQSGGELTIESATGSGTIQQLAGTLTVLAGAHASIIHAGTVYYRSTGTLSALKTMGGGVFDLRRDNRGRTISAAEIYSGGEIHDPNRTGTWSAGVDLIRCNIFQVTVDLGTHVTLTPSNV